MIRKKPTQKFVTRVRTEVPHGTIPPGRAMLMLNDLPGKKARVLDENGPSAIRRKHLEPSDRRGRLRFVTYSKEGAGDVRFDLIDWPRGERRD